MLTLKWEQELVAGDAGAWYDATAPNKSTPKNLHESKDKIKIKTGLAKYR